jgi:hypothetical protein
MHLLGYLYEANSLIRTAGNNMKGYRLGQSPEGDVDLWDTKTAREEVYIIISYHNYII